MYNFKWLSSFCLLMTFEKSLVCSCHLLSGCCGSTIGKVRWISPFGLTNFDWSGRHLSMTICTVLWQTFLFVCLLDISSHWCQMYSTSALGKHHKSEDGNEGRHFLVRWFYKYYYFFGYLCVGAEFTYIIAYAIQFTTEESVIHAILKLILWAVIPGCFLKQLVNVMQLASACYAVAQYDAETKTKWLDFHY